METNEVTLGRLDALAPEGVTRMCFVRGGMFGDDNAAIRKLAARSLPAKLQDVDEQAVQRSAAEYARLASAGDKVTPGVRAVRQVLTESDRRKAAEEDQERLQLAERFREAERALAQRKAGDAAARKEWENSRAKRVSLGVPETARPGDPVYEAGWDRYLAAERKYREVPTV